MFDVRSKRCDENNCNKHPAFNYETEIKRLYCSDHKKPNMIDVKSKRCVEKDCKKQPTFNY